MLERIKAAGKLIRAALCEGHLVLACGNGGSAAEAAHMTGEMVGRYLTEREGLPALALSVDPAILTAVANDYGYEEVFARQVRAYKDSARILVLLSTSGSSKNLLNAAAAARDNGITTIGLLGRDGGLLAELCDLPIIVPAWSVPEIQEAHLTIIHLLSGYVDGDYE